MYAPTILAFAALVASCALMLAVCVYYARDPNANFRALVPFLREVMERLRPSDDQSDDEPPPPIQLGPVSPERLPIEQRFQSMAGYPHEVLEHVAQMLDDGATEHLRLAAAHLVQHELEKLDDRAVAGVIGPDGAERKPAA